MKKGAILALAGLMAVSAAHASNRSAAFGSTGLYIADPSDRDTLPQTVNGTNFTTDDFGYIGLSSDLLGGTLYVGFGRGSWNFSSLFNSYNSFVGNLDSTSGYYNTYAPGGAYSNMNFGNWWGSNDVDGITDLIYAMNLNDSVRLGVGLSYGANNESETYKYEEPGTPDNNYDYFQTNGLMGLNLGADLKEVGPIKVLQIGLQYTMLNETINYNYTTAGTKYALKNAINDTVINVRVGGDLAGENGAFGRFELGLNSESWNQKADYGTATIPANSFVEPKQSASGLTLGYAAGKSGDKGMIIASATINGRTLGYDNANISGAQTNDKWDEGYLTLNVGSAGEYNFNSWLVLRGGFDANILTGGGEKYTYTDSNNNLNSYTETYSYNNDDIFGGTNTNLGATVKFGNFTVDGTINTNLLYSTAVLFNQNWGGVFGGVTVNYALGE